MQCSDAVSTLYDVMLEFSTNMGGSWFPLVEACLPPRQDCDNYHQGSQFRSAQHGNWTRVTLHLPDKAV